MPTSIYSLAPGRIGATVVPVKSVTVSPTIISEQDIHSGNPFPTLVRVSGAQPKLTMVVPFAPAWAAIGSFDVVRVTTLDVYFAKFLNYIRDPGAVHLKLGLSGTSAAAVMITGISVDQDGDLNATVEVTPISDGSFTNPIAITTAALPTLGSQPLLYTLGPVSINGTVIPGLVSAGADLAQQLIVQRSDGSKYAMAASRMSAAPRLFGEHADPGAIAAALTLDGANITSNVIQYFRSYNAVTGVVDNAASSGCSLTVAAGRIHPTDFSVTQGAIAKSGFEFLPLSATTTHPIAVSVTATVPTVT